MIKISPFMKTSTGIYSEKLFLGGLLLLLVYPFQLHSDTLDVHVKNDLPFITTPPKEEPEQYSPGTPQPIDNHRNTLPFNDCFFCQKKYRPWYISLRELRDASEMCGYDFIELRCDDVFSSRNKTVTICTYFRFYYDSITVDSLIYTVKSGTTCKRTIIQGTPKRINVNSDTVRPAMNHIDRDIDILTAAFRNFNPSVTFDPVNTTINYSADISGVSLIAQNDMLFWLEQHQKGTANSTASHSRIAYRLGSFLYRDICDSAYQSTITSGPRIESVDIGYILNISNIHCQIKADAGIDSVILRIGQLAHSYSCKGEKSLNFSSSIVIPDTTNFLTIEVIDRNARSAGTTVSVLDSLRKVTALNRVKQDDIRARAQWRKQNSLNNALTAIASMGGNPLSYVINKVVQNKVTEYQQLQKSTVDKNTVSRIFLPVAGRIVPSDRSLQLVTSTFCLVPGTSGNPFAMSEFLEYHPACKDKPVNFTLEIPSGQPTTIPTLNFTYDSLSIGHPHQPFLLVCGNITTNSNTPEIQQFPLILKSPSEEITFYTVLSPGAFQADTVSFHYTITFTDKSTTSYFRKIIPFYPQIEQPAANEFITNVQFNNIPCRDNVITISSESFEFSKRCMRIDIFAYAHKANVTFGAGALWVR
jgi:hypothetical protein